MTAPQTLYDKLWNSHVVGDDGNGRSILYIDLHLVHEVTSPQAFDGLRAAGRPVRRPAATIAVPDHNVATTADRLHRIVESESQLQLESLERNAAAFGITYVPLSDPRQGIVHIIGPEQGWTQPGKTIVCGDSHTATHGAFGALAFGIGTSEVEHVLATQTIRAQKSLNMRVVANGRLSPGVTAKDLILAIIGRIGTAGGTGHVIEYQGEAFEALSMEGRMTVCNMSIEAGARAGLMAPDETTFAYLRGRPHAPAAMHWEAAASHWRTLKTDAGAHFDKEIVFDAGEIAPHVTWGTSPEDTLPITGAVPDPAACETADKRGQAARALAYMGLTPGQPLDGIKIDKVFVGSCTNGRIEDLRAVAAILKGRKVAPGVGMMIVPGSGLVKRQAEAEGLAAIFTAAGADWREAGCSMCLGMNGDIIKPGERCAATSNRNFEGRQGPGGRTHLVSPAMAAAAAVTGHLTDVRNLTCMS